MLSPILVAGASVRANSTLSDFGRGARESRQMPKDALAPQELESLGGYGSDVAGAATAVGTSNSKSCSVALESRQKTATAFGRDSGGANISCQWY